MRLRRSPILAALLLLALTPAACATSGAVASGEALNVSFDVQNNTPGLGGVTLYLLTESGTRRNLGPAESNQRVAFDRSLRAGTYYLVATRVGAPDLQSERFRLDEDNMIVIWNMGQNAISLAKR